MEFGIELAGLVVVAIALILDGVRQEQEAPTRHAVLRPIRAPSRCPYCHEGLELTPEAQRARCGVCDTPHHAACWEESQRCSAFSCQSKEAFVLADPEEEAEPQVGNALPAAEG